MTGSRAQVDCSGATLSLMSIWACIPVGVGPGGSAVKRGARVPVSATVAGVPVMGVRAGASLVLVPGPTAVVTRGAVTRGAVMVAVTTARVGEGGRLLGLGRGAGIFKG